MARFRTAFGRKHLIWRRDGQSASGGRAYKADLGRGRTAMIYEQPDGSWGASVQGPLRGQSNRGSSQGIVTHAATLKEAKARVRDYWAARTAPWEAHDNPRRKSRRNPHRGSKRSRNPRTPLSLPNLLDRVTDLLNVAQHTMRTDGDTPKAHRLMETARRALVAAQEIQGATYGPYAGRIKDLQRAYRSAGAALTYARSRAGAEDRRRHGTAYAEHKPYLRRRQTYANRKRNPEGPGWEYSTSPLQLIASKVSLGARAASEGLPNMAVRYTYELDAVKAGAERQGFTARQIAEAEAVGRKWARDAGHGDGLHFFDYTRKER